MKRFIQLFLLPVLVLAQLAAAAQSKQGFVINGKVTSFEESLPLEGASIVVKGSSNATGTQADGTFSLFISPGDSLLVISLAGYEKKEIRTNAKNKQYDIVLRRSDNAITYLYPALYSNVNTPSKQPIDNYLPSALLSGNR